MVMPKLWNIMVTPVVDPSTQKNLIYAKFGSSLPKDTLVNNCF